MDRDGLKITIEGASSPFDARDLWTQATVALISEADTHWWEKLELERDISDPVTPADRFYAAVLSAVARHYAVDAMLPEDSEVHSVLFDLIAELTKKGRLRNLIRSGESSEQDRPDDD